MKPASIGDYREAARRRHALDLIEAEMCVAMALTGVTTVGKIGPDTRAA